MRARQGLIVPRTNAISSGPLAGADRTTDFVIIRLRQAEAALQAATTIHQAKLIADVAAAQEARSRRSRGPVAVGARRGSRHGAKRPDSYATFLTATCPPRSPSRLDLGKLGEPTEAS